MKKAIYFNSKRFVSLILIIALFASSGILSSCSVERKNPTALTLNGIEISNDVFTYFIDVAMTELDANADENSILTKATALTETYFKTNSLAKKNGVTLSTASKAGVSEKVNAYWGIYGDYYSSIGVSKETLTKIFTSEALRNQLLIHYYGEGGEEEISVASMYAYFKMNYIVFQAINGYFTYMDDNGNTVIHSPNQIEEIILKFQNMASLINAKEKTMEEAAEFLASTGYSSSVVTLVLGKDDTSYPEGFFEKVQSTKARLATVIGTNEYIFIVLRGDAGVNSEYYKEKKEEILKALVGDKIDVKIDKSLAVESSLNDMNTQSLYLLV
ncbi:MAG: hypothetical protein IIW72_05770, partial [Clostridia bacterium]|nr:hypothetical protein [Clostridia bacterium]